MVLGLLLAGGLAVRAGAAEVAPLFRDFMGINGHTVQFRPALYKDVVRQVRDYHPVDWDTGPDPATPTVFPLARNGVDWNAVYGSWRKAGFTTDACLMFDPLAATAWTDGAARAYGEAFARAFGPSSVTPLVASAELGNEPGKYPDAQYRRVFAAMAAGLRAGDPRLAILPCALTTTASGEYARGVACLEGLADRYDALNMHDYAQAEGWPTWRRSYPEDPVIPYLREVRDMLAWRDVHAAGKPVWVTEFGWDASTKKPPPGNDDSKWVGVTDLQQAQYLVRSFLVFARLGVGKAFIYFFNDEDHPGLHAAAGLTRNWRPKPSWYAVGHLRRALGDYRFDRVIREVPDDVYAYRFTHKDGADQAVIAVWSPTGRGRTGNLDLDLEGYTVGGITKMETTDRPVKLPRPVEDHGHMHVRFDESPVYLYTYRRR
jgi:hypothetical protein